MKKKARYRKNVILEMIKTEENYIRDISLLLEVFYS